MLRILSFIAIGISFQFNSSSQALSDITDNLPFRNIGPAFMTGRISDIAKDSTDPSTWYVATASGNAWKTENNGTTWIPIFDNYSSYSTGCIAIDPRNSQTIWLGTGENQSQRSVGWGDGIYKSVDGGKHWENMGLKNSEHIGKILIHPANSDIIYVASQGPLWSDGGDRGVYKSIDGGKHWKNILKISKHTGVSDLCFDTTNPDILYAASYQRRRHVGILVAGGPESRIYKSTNAGNDWRKLSKGLPGGELGRIAIAVSPQKSNVMYASIAGPDRDGGFYRSSNGGESWIKQSNYVVVDPQYYGEIYCDPHQFDKVFTVDVMVHYSENGGKSFEQLNSRFKHVDNHSILFDPGDPDYLMIGCDGGIYESWDSGNTWKFHSNLPIVQFYRVGLDNDYPFYNVYGGTQDNSTLFGPSATTSRHGITNADWTLALGGDGFQARVDPEDPNIVYCQSQYAGIVRYDRRTGSRIDIQPQPGPGEQALRWHWDSPLIISPHNAKRLYFAAQKLFKSDDRGNSWTAISDDLSRNEDRNQREVMGQVWSPEAVWKNVFTSPYGTIVSISESRLREGLIILGTDDGLIQITENGGESWKMIDRIPGIPKKAYVSDVITSQHNPNQIYAVFNNHKEGDFNPYVQVSNDLGKSWENLSSNIPATHACWTILEDHVMPGLLFLGTEFGVFCSTNSGKEWTQMKKGIPTIPIRDMEIQQRENDLVLASFGRGFFVLDDYSPLRQLSNLTSNNNLIFAIKEAKKFINRGDLGYAAKGVFGDAFYQAPNPPYGAQIRIFLAESFPSLKQKRKNQKDEEVVFPNYETLKKEDFELSPTVFLQFTNPEGKLLSKIQLKNRKGFQTANWDFRSRVYSENGDIYREAFEVNDGQYFAQVIALKNGQVSFLTEKEEFKVTSLDLTKEKASIDFTEFHSMASKTLQKAIEIHTKIQNRLKKIEKEKDNILFGKENAVRIGKLETERLFLLESQYQLISDQTKKKRFEYYLPGIIDRLRRVTRGAYGNYQVTQTQRDNYDIAKNEMESLINTLKDQVPELMF